MRDIAYIALGSNLGAREEYLERARSALGALPGTRVLRTSSVEETAPVGDVPQGAYLNQMVAIETTLTPRQLLDRLHEIERSAGRVRDVRWGPRTLDLDIVMFDRQTVNEPDLLVPHPELPNRGFWQRELAELRGSGGNNE
jgi:2-amino-4-hydroxy-6-hydroxymethyldihydropteridine diphosphokinase